MTATSPTLADPRTLAELAASVATTDPVVRAYYLLRNAGAFGFDLGAVLAYLTETAGLVCHRLTGGHPLAGSYGLREPAAELLFRVTPTTPGVNGPLPFPGVVIVVCRPRRS